MRLKYLNKIGSVLSAVICTVVLFCLVIPVLAGNEPVYKFIENKGQWDARVKFRSDVNGGALYLESNAFTYHFIDYSEILAWHLPMNAPKDKNPDDAVIRGHAFRIEFQSANPSSKLVTRNPVAEYYNYYKGKDPARWVSGAKGYKNVYYISMYKNIDMEIYTTGSHMKYDFILHPGSDPKDIRMAYHGVDGLNIQKGKLMVTTSVNRIIEEEPYAYQMINGIKQEVKCKFSLRDSVVGFEVTGNYDKSKDLIIDPTLIFSSYSGSTANNFGMTATYDNTGNFYSGGTVFDNGFPTTLGAYDVSFNNSVISGVTDVIITKYTPNGNAHVYSTYLGGSGTEAVHSLIVNSSNELYLYGTTSSPNFPVSGNAYDNSFNGGTAAYFIYNGTDYQMGTDIYVTKFNSGGTALLGSTYIGGSENDGLNYNTSNLQNYDSLQANYGDQCRGEVIVDAAGNCYIASSTRSSDFPIVSGYDNTFGGKQDAVIMKFNSNLSALQWSTFLGGSEKDAAYSLKLGTTGNVHVVGGTISLNFPTTSGALFSSYQGGKSDGFISVFNSSGNTLLRSSLYGTSGVDQIYFVDLDKNDNIYVVGQSEGGIPIINANYSNPGSGQFISKINSQLSTIVYSTLFGNGSGNADLSPAAFMVDNCENVYVSGWGGNIITGPSMTNMPVTGDAHFATPPNGYDFYVFVMKRDAEALLYASYFGGAVSQEHVDGGTSRFDKSGVIYQSVCAGCQNNDDFPTTPGAWSNDNLSTGCNNGIFKIAFEINPEAKFTATEYSGCAPLTITFQNASTVLYDYLWNFGNGDTSSVEFQPTRTFSTPGTYQVLLTVTDSICQLTDTAVHHITVFPAVTATGSNVTLCKDDTVTLSVSSSNATEFIWSTSSTFSDTLNTNLSDTTITLINPTQTTYYIKASNTNCSSTTTASYTIATLQASAQSTGASNCGSCTGQATVTISNGTAPYDYAWSDGSTDSSIGGLCVGSQSVTVTDANGCQQTLAVNIVDTSNVLVTLQDSSLSLCAGDCDGALTVGTSGGTPPYTYLWNQGAQTPTLSGLCPNEYVVTVTDVDGCKNVLALTVAEPTPLSSSMSVTQSACNGNCSGSITLNVTGGTSPYIYNWSQTGVIGSSPTGLCAGNYSVTITDANGCTHTLSAQVTQPSLLAATAEASGVSCFNTCDGTAEAKAVGGTTPYTFLWNTGDTLSALDDRCSGLYGVTITDANGCQVVASATIDSSEFYVHPIQLSASEDTIWQGETVILQATTTGTGVSSWQPAGSVTNPNQTTTPAMPNQTTTYTYVVTDSTNGECSYGGSITIYVNEYVCGDPNVFIPNAFTPDGDGNNDEVAVRGNNLKELYFTIYNRWGEMVFETRTANTGWNGTFNGMKADPGVFVYYLTATCNDGEQYFRKGNITLLR